MNKPISPSTLKPSIVQKTLKNILNQIRQPHLKTPSFWLGWLAGAATLLSVMGLNHQWKIRSGISTEGGKSLYALGQMYGHRVESLDLTSSEAKILSQGFQDWVHQQVSRVDYSKFEPRIQDFIEMRQKKSIERNHELGQQYLSQFTRSGGGLLTLSGLGYKTLEPGTAKKPTLKDSVEVSYRGTLVNGQLVDQTDEKNSKVILPMNAIIPGWSEGLQLIGEGGEIELVVPSELAYGESGTNNGVPPGATLHFQIRLHRVLDSGREKTT